MIAEKKLDKLYDDRFYSRLIDGMSGSAMTVLGMLFEHYKPKSMIDIGCGRGAWLAAAEGLGVAKLKGMDGEWIDEGALLSQNIDFSPVNFDRAMPELDEKYDLCMSVEVAEHLSETNARAFVDLLCKASDVVLFSAAIKYQGGTNHINEQWQSYWVDLFESNGYRCLDMFRPHLWNDGSVRWWYRQNLFLFVNRSNTPAELESVDCAERPILDMAHPIGYEMKMESHRRFLEDPPLRFCLSCLARWGTKKLQKVKHLFA